MGGGPARHREIEHLDREDERRRQAQQGNAARREVQTHWRSATPNPAAATTSIATITLALREPSGICMFRSPIFWGKQS